MPEITIKYGLGDRVYSAFHHSATRSEVCPDCLGTKNCVVTFAGGESYECGCVTCKRQLVSTGTILVDVQTPAVKTLTIGQVGYENGEGRYMCKETGIGSGSVYYDSTLFSTYEEAFEEAKNKCKAFMKNIAKQNFNKKNRFADALDCLGYKRSEAIAKEKEMQRWIELIEGAK